MNILICRPDLGLPFKMPPVCGDAVRRAFDTDGVRAVRAPWAQLVDLVAARLRAAGHVVSVLERPNWQFVPKLIDFYAPDLALLPHRSAHQMPGLETPALYYAQMYCRWLFTFDPRGWGASSSRYGDEAWCRAEADGASFDRYRQMLVDERQSKFDQPEAHAVEASASAVAEAPGDYLLFPCQIPHDQTLQFHSDVGEIEAVALVSAWANARRLAVVFKEHPVNPASMAPLRAAAPETAFVKWRAGNIHDLLAGCRAVVTVNSGVGFEAMFHMKPIVTLGCAEYDVVSFQARASLTSLDQAFHWVQSLDEPPADAFYDPAAVLESNYRRFVSWYCDDYAVDLAGDRLDARLDALAAQCEAAGRRPAEAAAA